MKDETLRRVSGSVRGFLQENYLFGYEEEDFADESSLMEHGVLDSLGVLELIAFLESEFGIKVADEEILPENFDSVNGISRFVINKLNVTV